MSGIEPALDEAALASFLRAAHTAISAGDPAQALRLVLTVLQAVGGQAAAAPALNRVLSQLTSESPAAGGAHRCNALAELTDMLARASLNAPAGQAQPPQAGPWHAAGTAGDQHAGAAVAHSDDSMSTSGGAGAVAAAAAAGPGVAGGGPSWGRGVEEATSAWSGGGGELGRQLHAPILSETGREGFMSCALADGSSYVCGGCGGVVVASRRRQHEQFWCSAGSGAAAGAGAGAAAGAGAGMDEELGSD